MPPPEKLQLTAQDARYLRDEFASAVEQKTSLHLPGNDPTDPLILRVRQLVSDFVTETMQLSRHALVVDGKDMGHVTSIDAHLRDATEHIEPFDMALAEELRKVYAEVDETTVRLSEMRKGVPQVIAELYKQAEVDCGDIGQPAEEGQTLDGVLEELPPVEELDEEEKETFKQALQEIKRLRGAVPETQTRLEELRKVKEVVGGL